MVSPEILSKKKEVDLKILCALLSMGGRSNREIAKSLGMTNVTVSRRKKKLEQEGYIKEYTAIPDFSKIGLEYVVITTSSGSVTPQDIEEIKKSVQKYPEILWMLQDENLAQTQWVILSVHKNYESYLELVKEMQKTLMPKLHQNINPQNFNVLMFHTAKSNLKPLSFKNFNAILLPEKNSIKVNRKNVKH
jgi:DNA-binding Lrp family transcriptional regulator